MNLERASDVFVENYFWLSGLDVANLEVEHRKTFEHYKYRTECCSMDHQDENLGPQSFFSQMDLG
jgi:hypothetical protein